ncbi:HAMP domain-containing histidine kinase [Neolewinella aurantiaca]|uniref:histidine kinase n=1 Tax=Neolewinella aurantiaca TaxID=2602767 RepID=A0A5C7FFY2_9BACT|nr:HAMP domain-containing sensor histidine kinase [Neolewinella aurantiaca]TXF88567.1 HAMP domain-containing histidine kinase [Neolewinella aurantiaca]
MKHLLYVFSFIMLLMSCLLGTWWYQSYEHDRSELRKQVERDLDDLLVNNVFRKAVPFFMRGGPVWEGGDPIERLQRNEAYLEYSISSMRKNARIIVEAMPESQRQSPIILRFPDDHTDKKNDHKRLEKMLSGGKGETFTFPEKNNRDYSYEFPRHITIKDNPFRADSQTFTFHFQDDGFTLGSMPAEVLDTLRYRHKVNLTPLRFSDKTGRLLTNSADMRVKTELINTGLHKDPSYFEITNYRSTVLLGLLPEFFFGFLLFGATGFAFFTAYRNLHEQEKQLKQKDALVANVAHELKTPIATVGVALEALNLFGADEDPARRQEYLAIGQSELKRLDQMADRAIDSLQAGDLSQRLRFQKTNLTNAVVDAWRGLSLRYNLPEEALTLHIHGDVDADVDPHYWHHLVYNLLDNACKYGGSPAKIEVAVSGQAHDTVLTISDNGPGIASCERENIFKRFYRITRPGEGHAVKGHGLGLTFVRQVAEAHGGSVKVDNTSAGGARFTVKIPRN